LLLSSPVPSKQESDHGCSAADEAEALVAAIEVGAGVVHV
jgi:hypothetical protein